MNSNLGLQRPSKSTLPHTAHPNKVLIAHSIMAMEISRTLVGDSICTDYIHTRERAPFFGRGGPQLYGQLGISGMCPPPLITMLHIANAILILHESLYYMH